MIMHATCRPPLMSRPLVARTRQRIHAPVTRPARGLLVVAQVIAVLVHTSVGVMVAIHRQQWHGYGNLRPLQVSKLQ